MKDYSHLKNYKRYKNRELDYYMKSIRDPQSGLFALCCAVVFQAKVDADRGDVAAQEWLETDPLARKVLHANKARD